MVYVMQDDETYFYSPIPDLNDFYEKVLEVPIITVNKQIKNFIIYLVSFI